MNTKVQAGAAATPQSFNWRNALWTGRGLFETRDLVTIGLFAGAAKAATLVVALMGGGMNPVTMVLKSALFSALWVVLLVKVPKTGTLTLANTVGALLAFFLMGQTMITLPSLMAATLLVEVGIRSLGGYQGRPWLAALAVGLSELASRVIHIAYTYLWIREQPALLAMVAVISLLSYFGICLGLFGGLRMVRELRHAGLIQN
ncbi:MAG: MptD family putative ECF transporter S component [Candidatus Adiutrix sp.]|nr:MptD family putative ECF transporter S component [Candidatus Adiutrix sp.]